VLPGRRLARSGELLIEELEVEGVGERHETPVGEAPGSARASHLVDEQPVDPVQDAVVVRLDDALSAVEPETDQPVLRDRRLEKGVYLGIYQVTLSTRSQGNLKTPSASPSNEARSCRPGSVTRRLQLSIFPSRERHDGILHSSQ